MDKTNFRHIGYDRCCEFWGLLLALGSWHKWKDSVAGGVSLSLKALDCPSCSTGSHTGWRSCDRCASDHHEHCVQTHPKHTPFRPLIRCPCVCNTGRYYLRGRVLRTNSVPQSQASVQNALVHCFSVQTGSRERLLKGSPPACQQCQQCQCKLPRAPLLLPRCLWVMWLRLMWW